MEKEKDTIIAQQSDRIKQLEQEIAQLKSTGRRARKSRSYNTRDLKDYPRPQDTAGRRPAHAGDAVGRDAGVRVIRRTADIRCCPTCGGPLSESAAGYGRTSEDALDGAWFKTEWTVMRRYCKRCGRQYSASPDGVLPGEHFGVVVMAQVFAMRCLAIPHEKIARIIHMLYGRFIEVSGIIHMCDTVADECAPLYDGVAEEIRHCSIMFGDDTGWFLGRHRWWVWAFITSHAVLFHLSPSRSKLVTEAITEGFEGITVSDSHSSWNDVGSERQKCLLHYFRDMYRTLKENDGPEFKSFFKRLHSILKDAIGQWIKYKDAGAVPESSIRRLQGEIDRLTDGTYEDADCRRYVKRLRREGRHLLTFLRHDGVRYHNNTSERALRPFALMRKVCYGNRSRRGIRTTEILMTIYSTCEMRGVNPYTFMIDYLGGGLKTIPMPTTGPIAAAAA